MVGMEKYHYKPVKLPQTFAIWLLVLLNSNILIDTVLKTLLFIAKDLFFLVKFLYIHACTYLSKISINKFKKWAKTCSHYKGKIM